MTDTPDDVEEDDEWVDEMAKTGYSCLLHEAEIVFGDDVVVYYVVAASHAPSERQNMPITTDGSRLLWDPKFVLLEAFNELTEQITEETKDITPIIAKTANHVCDCSYCGSSILEGELYIRAVYGQIQQSQRYPNGQFAGHTFVPMDEDPTINCLSCYRRMHERVLALWDHPIRQSQECEHGTNARCWRHGCSANAATSCNYRRGSAHPQV
jgi:hypothetical protein